MGRRAFAITTPPPSSQKLILKCCSGFFSFFFMGADAAEKLVEERDLGAAFGVIKSTKSWGPKEQHFRGWGGPSAFH